MPKPSTPQTSLPLGEVKQRPKVPMNVLKRPLKQERMKRVA